MWEEGVGKSKRVELLGDEEDISLVGNVPKKQKLRNIVKCKSCNYQFKCLLQHIRRSENCQVHYSESDINDLRDAAKLMTRVAKREWEVKNIDLRKAKWAKNKAHKSVQNAEYYQKNKSRKQLSLHRSMPFVCLILMLMFTWFYLIIL